MNNDERLLVIKRIKKELSNEEFLGLFTTNIEKNPNYFDKLLVATYIEKNGDDLGLLFYIGFLFDLFQEKHLEILNKLILEDWHKTHEDIANLLQYFKSNLSVESLYETTFIKFKYLNYTDALAVKCIWALADINTSESKKKLELLSKSKDKVIKKNAIQQLKRLASRE